MKILILFLLPLTLFSQEILKKKGDKVMISSADIELVQGKKYVVQSDSGEALIGVYKNLSAGNYVAKVLSGDLNVGDRIDSFARKSSSTYSSSGSSSSSITSSTGKIYDPINWGIFWGTNYSGGTATDEVTAGEFEETKHDAGLGFQGGVVLDVNFNPSMTFSTKLSFATYRNTVDNFDGLGTNGEFKTTTISIEPRFKYKFLSNSMGHRWAYVFAGARIGKALSAELIATNPLAPAPQKVDLLDDTQNQGVEVSSILVDLPIGIGANFKLGRINSLILSPNFTYYLQVGNFSEGPGLNDKFKASTMAFNVDLLF